MWFTENENVLKFDKKKYDNLENSELSQSQTDQFLT